MKYENLQTEYKRSVVVLYPLFVYLLAILLPEKFLEHIPLLASLIDYLEQYIPALKGIELRAKYPDVFQTLYVVHILAIFLLIIVMKMTNFINPKKLEHSKTLWLILGCFCMVSLLMWMLGFYLFSEKFGDGVTRIAKISQSIGDSKLSFSIWTGMITLTLSMFVLGWLIVIKEYAARLLNYRS